MTSETNFVRREDLLERSLLEIQEAFRTDVRADLFERALVELREVLRSDVETACDLMGPDSDRTPAPGTCDLPWVEPINRTLGLVRDIEATIGTPADLKWTPELTGPSWLTDLVEGKWGLT